MSLKQIKCTRCGGELTKIANTYKCNSCNATFIEDYVSNNEKIISEFLNELKQEKVAALRQRLWEQTHAKYLSSKEISSISKEIRGYLPEDFLSKFYELACSKNKQDVIEFLNNIDYEENYYNLDLVVEFMLRNLNSENLLSVNNLIENSFKSKDLVTYRKYTTELSKEAEKIEEGVYETTLPRDIFIAYSSKDMETVEKITTFLEAQGLKCFVAMRNLRHGAGAVENYDKALEEAIDNCKIFLFISSKNSRSLDCDAIKKEIPYVKKDDIRTAPAEYKHNYVKMPNKYKKPRVQYVIDVDKGSIGGIKVNEFFSGHEWCLTLDDLIQRISDIIFAVEEEDTYSNEKIEEKPSINQQQIDFAKKLEEQQQLLQKQQEEFLAKQQKELEEQKKLLAKQQEELNRKLEEQEKKVESKTKSIEKEISETKELGKIRAQASETEVALSQGFKIESTKYTQNILQEYTGSDVDIIVPNIVKYVGESSFKKVKNTIKFVMFDENSELIDVRENTFFGYPELKEVLFGNNVKSFGKMSIFNCPKLEKIFLPNSVNSIGDFAFAHNPNLKEICYSGTKNQWKAITKSTLWNSELPKTCLVKCLSGTLNVYGEDVDLADNQITFGSYQQKETGAKTPLVWDILKREGNKALIVTSQVIDEMKYSDRLSNYQNSGIRKWLNSTFIDTAFSKQEQNKIISTIVDNSVKSTGYDTNPYVCINTGDKVFLLSYDEIANQFPEYKITTFTFKANSKHERGHGYFWWLRSPTNYSEQGVRTVSSTGEIKYGSYPSSNGGVRPACWINLKEEKSKIEDTVKPDDKEKKESSKATSKTTKKVTETKGETKSSTTKNNVEEKVKQPVKKVIKINNEIIKYGTYPQTQVKDDNLIKELNNLFGKIPTKNDAYGKIPFVCYKNRARDNYMWYKDVILNKEKYRGVVLSDYKPSDYYEKNNISFQQKEKGFKLGVVYWFKFEPIEWIVIRTISETTYYKKERKVLLSKLVLDAQAFNHESLKSAFEHNGRNGLANEYEYSDIRIWLNSDFNNTAFSELQQKYITKSYIGGIYPSPIHPIELDTLKEYCKDDNIRLTTGTDYASIQGLFTNYTGTADWFTMTPEKKENDCIKLVMDNGTSGSTISYDVVSKTIRGVRPFMWFESQLVKEDKVPTIDINFKEEVKIEETKTEEKIEEKVETNDKKEDKRTTNNKTIKKKETISKQKTQESTKKEELQNETQKENKKEINLKDFDIYKGRLREYKGNESIVVIPDSVDTIGNEAFRDCLSIKEVTISPNVVEIENSAFWGCSNLEKIDINQNKLKRIGVEAFFECTSLKSIYIPKNVNDIGFNAFGSCKSLDSIIVDKGNTKFSNYKDKYNIIYDFNEKTIVVGCKTSIIPNETIVIGSNAFSGCDIKSINIPTSVKKIGLSAFEGCEELINVSFEKGTYLNLIGARAFFNCSKLKSISIPDSVETIGQFAFGWCDELSEVIIPDSITVLGECAFNHRLAQKGNVLELKIKKKKPLFGMPKGWEKNWYIADSNVKLIWGYKN